MTIRELRIYHASARGPTVGLRILLLQQPGQKHHSRGDFGVVVTSGERNLSAELWSMWFATEADASARFDAAIRDYADLGWRASWIARIGSL